MTHVSPVAAHSRDNTTRPLEVLRAVSYARYSSENQREASIADQFEVCDRYIDRNNWSSVGRYDDAAISGASRHRPGLQRLLADAEAGRFDIVVTEAVDRLGRKLADVAELSDRLTFARVQIHAVNVGHLSPMHIGIMGTMAQMMLSDMRDKVRRGQLGRARAGRMPGGLAFGYDIVPPPPGARESGERRINAAEAATVRRIFEAYADGASPRTLARTLNEEGVPGPGGRPWIDTTIRGQLDRGTGLLNNSVYIGQLSWDRCSYVKNPQTGRRVARVNPIAQREVTAVPELRIIDQALWDRVKARQDVVRITMTPGEPVAAGQTTHRQKFLLSGLITCGVCGGGYTIIGADRYGCATRRGKGTCDNGHTITRQAIEARVLGGLKQRMLAPELVEEFVRAFADECARADRDRAHDEGKLHKERLAVERSLAGILKAIEAGAWNETLRSRLTELELRKSEIDRELATAAAPVPVALHPNAAGLYAARVADLETALNDSELLPEAAATLRSLIQHIVLTPDPEMPQSLAIDLHGDLAMILSLAAGGSGAIRRRGHAGSGSALKEKLPRTHVLGSQLTVVAGTGFEPVTFRL